MPNIRGNSAQPHIEIAARRAPSPPRNQASPESLTNWSNASTLYASSMSVIQRQYAVNDEPLPFGPSYWDYLPDLVQNKIAKLVHKAFLEQVHEELCNLFYCTQCGDFLHEVFMGNCECDCGTCAFDDDDDDDSWLDFVCECEGECICDLLVSLHCDWCGRRK